MSNVEQVKTKERQEESRINVRIKGPMVSYLDSVTGSQGLYENPSEYIRDLIRHDMERPTIVDDKVMEGIMHGVKDWKEGRFTAINSPEELDNFMDGIMDKAISKAAKK